VNSQKLSNVDSLSKHLLIVCIKFFLMRGVIILRASFEMLSESETFSFESLLIVCSTCSAVTAEKMSSMLCADTFLLMLLRSACSLSEKNFSVRICVLKELSSQLLSCSDLHNDEM